MLRYRRWGAAGAAQGESLRKSRKEDEMDKSTMIGIKCVVMGLIAFAVCVFILAKIMNQSVSVGVGVAAMSTMVMLCSSEAYKRGKKEQNAAKTES